MIIFLISGAVLVANGLENIVASRNEVDQIKALEKRRQGMIKVATGIAVLAIYIHSQIFDKSPIRGICVAPDGCKQIDLNDLNDDNGIPIPEESLVYYDKSHKESLTQNQQPLYNIPFNKLDIPSVTTLYDRLIEQIDGKNYTM